MSSYESEDGAESMEVMTVEKALNLYSASLPTVPSFDKMQILKMQNKVKILIIV